VLIDTSANLLGWDEFSIEYRDAYVAKCGRDPRESKSEAAAWPVLASMDQNYCPGQAATRRTLASRA